MHNLTKNIGRSRVPKNISPGVTVEINRVLICRPNHRLGNLLLITPLLQEVIAAFPASKIDLVVQGGLAPILFENYDNVDKIIQLPKKPFENLMIYFRQFMTFKKQKYDMAINAVHTSSSGKLYTLFANAKYKIFNEVDIEFHSSFEDHEHIAKYQVYSFRNYIAMLGHGKNKKPVASINLKLSPSEIALGQNTLKEIVNNEKKTISIFTFATDDKCHSESWWEEFYDKLKAQHPTHNIVEVLPIENVSQIAFKAPTFYSKDIRLITAVIANTEVFIGADSGIMHLASSAQVPVIGLFSRDNQNVYQPFGNNSLVVNTNAIDIDGCLKILRNILIKQ